MKERPILFNGPMVRAILDGRKTQTRRIVKPETPTGWQPEVGAYHPTKVDRHGDEYPGAEVFGAADECAGRLCPYGQPGDRLWVRETVWIPRPRTQHDLREGADTWPKCIYSADTDATEIEWMLEHRWKQRPSIHMPRWASRITLEITCVRVERLSAISAMDAEAEGLRRFPFEDSFAWAWRDGDKSGHASPTGAFRNLWESINGAGSWDANPWVWVVEFKRVEAT